MSLCCEGKVKAARERKGAAGGGGSGAAKRKEAMTKASVLCTVCRVMQPSLKTMQIHYSSRHPKETFPMDVYSTSFGSAKVSALDLCFYFCFC